jgi:hypothetical protein
LYYYAYDFSQLAQIFLADPRPLSPGYELTGAQSAPLPNTFVIFVRFVVKDLFSFGCGFAALGSLWLNFFSF